MLSFESPSVWSSAVFFGDYPQSPAIIPYARQKVGGALPVLAGVSRGEWSSEAVRIHFAQAEGKVADPIVSSGWLTIIAGPDLDGLCDKFRKRGVKIVSEPAPSPWGGREFEIEDCNGYILNFWTPQVIS
jgi:hypothetical protein